MAGRRIPITKIYRAFPELDAFSDETCRAYVRTVHRSHFGSWIFMTVGRLVLAWGGFFMLIGLGGLLISVVFDVRPDRSAASTILMGLLIAGSVAVPWFFSISIRDRWLRRKIAQHLRAAVCVRCAYSLLGLPVVAGLVMCPECGEALSLEKMGLKPEDILAGARDGDAALPIAPPTAPPTKPVVPADLPL